MAEQVLNAFRHLGQGNKHPKYMPPSNEDVLNAFRHLGQGNDGTAYGGKAPVGLNACSTPFGISARGTVGVSAGTTVTI